MELIPIGTETKNEKNEFLISYNSRAYPYACMYINIILI